MAIKIVMQGVASYKAPATLESDKRVTLVYGLNGAGKSTISNYLYASDSAEYQHCSNEGFGSADLLVYNSRFVRDNFFEIDKLNGIFTLSKANKQVELKIADRSARIKALQVERETSCGRNETIDRSMASLRSTAEETIWKIKTLYSGGDRVLEYCLEGLKIKSRLFDHISSIPLVQASELRSVDVIKKEVEALQGERAKPYPLIPFLLENAATVENDEIFKRLIIGKSDSPVSDLISKLRNADWVSQGLQYVEILEAEGSETCPFCQTATLTVQVTQVIRDYFDKSFSEAVGALKLASERHARFIAAQPELGSHLDNPFLTERLDEFEAILGQLSRIWQANTGLIQKKIDAPSIIIELTSTENLIQKINSLILDVNNQVEAHNRRVSDKKSALNSLKIEFWKRCRADYDSAISAHNSAIKGLILEKANESKVLSAVDLQISTLTAELMDLQKNTVNVDAAIDSINWRLQGLGIDSFRIIKAGENRYRLSRNGTSADDFQTLSEGEKTVISFVYFVELCKGKKSPHDISLGRIAVIDDPISSLSHIYVFHIGQIIKDEFSNSDLFDHVIILTHSLYFFYELTDIKKERREANQKLMRVVKNSSGSSIVEMKYEEIQNDYQAYWSVVMDEEQHPALIANCMRNIIEYFFNFLRKKDLNNVFQMKSLKDAKHQAFCRFMNRESHSLGQNIFDYKEFDYAQFKEAFKLVFTDSGFPEHYAAMSK
jgi:wobble nucleotide-excising tRNase